jgi:hypothetical protein
MKQFFGSHRNNISTEAIVFLSLYMNKYYVFNRVKEKLETYIADFQFYNLWNNNFKEVVLFCFIRIEKYDIYIK